MPRPPNPPAARGRGQRRQAAVDDAVSLASMLSMTIKNACAATQISADGMYTLLRDGEISSFTLGRRRYIIVQSLRDYLTRRAAEPLSIRTGPNSRQVGAQDGFAAEPAPKP